MGRNDFRFFKNTLPKLSFLQPKNLKLYPSKHVETSKYLGRVCAPEGAKSGRNESLPVSGGDQWYHGYFQWRHCHLKNVPNFSEGFWSLAHRKKFLAFQRVKPNALRRRPTRGGRLLGCSWKTLTRPFGVFRKFILDLLRFSGSSY